MRAVYRLRKRTTGRSTAAVRHDSFEVGMPQEIAERLVEKGFDLFTVELTTDGILYRPVKALPVAELVEVPEWLR